MKSKIVILIGRSSTGKSTILNQLVSEYDWNNCISYATRPMRSGEIDGRDYYYLSSNEEFDKMFSEGEMFEKTEYVVNGEVWKYGIGHNSISDDKINILIVNPDGLEQLINSELKERLSVCEVMVDTDTIIKRYWERSDKTDKSKIQLIDRLFKDYEDFNNENVGKLLKKIGNSDNIFYINNDGESSIEEIAQQIKWFLDYQDCHDLRCE